MNEEELFINADFYEHESKIVDDMLKKMYEQFFRKNVSGDELTIWLQHAFEEDMPMSLTEQSSILKEIGFITFDLLWVHNSEVIYRASK